MMIMMMYINDYYDYDAVDDDDDNGDDNDDLYIVCNH